MAEGASLLRKYRGNSIEGSNPSPSASLISDSVRRNLKLLGKAREFLGFLSDHVLYCPLTSYIICGYKYGYKVSSLQNVPAQLCLLQI